MNECFAVYDNMSEDEILAELNRVNARIVEIVQMLYSILNFRQTYSTNEESRIEDELNVITQRITELTTEENVNE